jgi:hypothetical protein
MSDEGYWWLALGLGLVVAVVAVVLLETFLRQVHRIERGAGAVWQAGKEVARNTATTWMLGATGDRLDRLSEETTFHAELLSPAPRQTARAATRATAARAATRRVAR